MSYHRFEVTTHECQCKPRCPSLDECHDPKTIVEKYGSFEVFYNASLDPEFVLDPNDPKAEPAPVGWYWWSCFPGCMPDGEAQGPYESEEEAIQMAQAEA